MVRVDSICRLCLNQCAIRVDVEDGRVLKVVGNGENPVFHGYTCVKGRSQPELLAHQDRLLHPLRRRPDGGHERVPLDEALADIGARLSAIVAEHGPRAVATYSGTMGIVATSPTSIPLHAAFADAIGTPMRFDPNTIDKGGKQAAQSFLGTWGAPSQGFADPEAILLIGVNPLVTYTGFPAGAPARWLADVQSRGCRLIVVDPRATEVARKADHFLQVRPGQDVELLLALIKVVLEEGLADATFVADHVTGVDRLTALLQDVDVAAVARLVDVPVEELVAAARTYGRARRGYTMAGTGPSFLGVGTIAEYLVLVLDTLCGRWLRAGDPVRQTPALLPVGRFVAQATGPDADWAGPAELRVRGLRQSRAGMPTAALPEEILTPGEGRVRALISWGGNPAVAFPDQEQAVRALESLDLFVQVDPWYTESARLADYVVPPTMPLETASSTAFQDGMSLRGTGYGMSDSYAQYAPPVAERPAGSDLVEEWEFFHDLLRVMGLPVLVRPYGHAPDAPLVELSSKPTAEDLLELSATGARVPLATVREQPGGALYPEGVAVVEPGDPGHPGRLDVGSAEMIARIRDHLARPSDPAAYPFRLLSRRPNHVYNSSHHLPSSSRGETYNPAHVHPEDLAELGLGDGDLVRIRSQVSSIVGVVRGDPTLRRGTVSMAFGYGVVPGREADVREVGSSTARLLSATARFDPYTGQPRMSDVPVALEPVRD